MAHQTGELSLEEGMALRLAFLQSASLRAICAIMNCPRYAEMLLVPRAVQEKVGGGSEGGRSKVVGGNREVTKEEGKSKVIERGKEQQSYSGEKENMLLKMEGEKVYFIEGEKGTFY